jgi:uncharacterized protein (DUF1330 family)
VSSSLLRTSLKTLVLFHAVIIFVSVQSIIDLYEKNKMIFLTQLIYIKDGQESIFDEFESIAIPAISKYNGRLLLRIRPAESAFIEHHIDRPYEIHLVEFGTDLDFENFKHDEERKKFLHLKEQSIKSAMLIAGKLQDS